MIQTDRLARLLSQWVLTATNTGAESSGLLWVSIFPDCEVCFPPEAWESPCSFLKCVFYSRGKCSTAWSQALCRTSHSLLLICQSQSALADITLASPGCQPQSTLADVTLADITLLLGVNLRAHSLTSHSLMSHSLFLGVGLQAHFLSYNRSISVCRSCSKHPLFPKRLRPNTQLTLFRSVY